MIAASIGGSLAISVAMDAVVLGHTASPDANTSSSRPCSMRPAFLQSLVGGRHRVAATRPRDRPIVVARAGRLTDSSRPCGPQPIRSRSLIDPQQYLVVSWASSSSRTRSLPSWPAGCRCCSPRGDFPGRDGDRRRSHRLVGHRSCRDGRAPGPDRWAASREPFGVDGWPDVLQPFVDLIPLEMVALLAPRRRRSDHAVPARGSGRAPPDPMACLGRGGHRHRDRRDRGRFALGNDSAPITQSTTLVAYAGIMLMPVAIGIAVLRYRLYEIDRIISRTIGWAIVTGVSSPCSRHGRRPPGDPD